MNNLTAQRYAGLMGLALQLFENDVYNFGKA